MVDLHMIKEGRALSQTEVSNAIRQAILAHELAPGSRLIEAELCGALRSSRGTVRAALMDLEHEGLVERIANRGARVRIVGLEEALQIADVRMAVELLCVTLAAEKITDADIAKLKQMASQLTQRAEAGDTAGFAELTHQVFLTYVEIADQPIAAEVLARLRDRLTGHRLRLTYRPERARVSLPYWHAIIEAICARDPIRAQEALRAHVANVKEHMKTVSQVETPLGRLGRK